MGDLLAILSIIRVDVNVRRRRRIDSGTGTNKRDLANKQRLAIQVDIIGKTATYENFHQTGTETQKNLPGFVETHQWYSNIATKRKKCYTVNLCHNKPAVVVKFYYIRRSYIRVVPLGDTL
jgi:hypothetical protein